MVEVRTPQDQDIIDINNNISDINTSLVETSTQMTDVINKVDNKVNKDGTKVLSDNNYSNIDKSKVDKITTLETDINTRALKSELDKTNTQLEDIVRDTTTKFSEVDNNKANKNEVFSMANMGQDIKVAMTGGSVAVVGKNAVLTENILNEQVTFNKTNLFDYDSILDLSLVKINTSIHISNGLETPFQGSLTFGFTKVISNADYYLKGDGLNVHIYFYGSDKNFISYGGDIGQGGVVVRIPAGVAFVRLATGTLDATKVTFSVGNIAPQYTTPKLKNKYLDTDTIYLKGTNVQDIPINNCSFAITCRNELKGKPFINNKVINPDTGNIEGIISVPRSTWEHYIDVKYHRQVVSNFTGYYALYDVNKKYISGGVLINSTSWTNPNVYYIRVSANSINNDELVTYILSGGKDLVESSVGISVVNEDHIPKIPKGKITGFTVNPSECSFLMKQNKS